MLSEDIRSFID